MHIISYHSFFGMCLSQFIVIISMHYKLHSCYSVPFMRGSWILTTLSVILVIVAVPVSIEWITIIGGVKLSDVPLSRPDIIKLCVALVWLMSFCRLVRFIVISHKAPLSVIIFYTIIYPMFVPVAICGLAAGFLAKLQKKLHIMITELMRKKQRKSKYMLNQDTIVTETLSLMVKVMPAHVRNIPTALYTDVMTNDKIIIVHIPYSINE